MALPFLLMSQVRVRCTHCGRDQVKLRAAVVLGSTQRCPNCRRSFVVRQVHSITSAPASRRPY